jgi:hypothetical protein
VPRRVTAKYGLAILRQKGASATPLGWLYDSETLSRSVVSISALGGKLKSQAQRGLAAKAAYSFGAFLPDKGAWLRYWRLCRWWRRRSEKNNGPTPMERLCKDRRPGRAELNSPWED